MQAFDYVRPAVLADAVRALQVQPHAKLLAGGQTLIPAMKLRLNRPAAICSTVWPTLRVKRSPTSAGSPPLWN